VRTSPAQGLVSGQPGAPACCRLRSSERPKPATCRRSDFQPVQLRHATFRPGEQGSARTNLLLAIVFLLCIAASGYWFYTISKRGSADAKNEAANPPVIQLSDATRAALGRLDAPLEIRFYSVLDPASVPASVNAFADRVDRLLAAYQQEAGGKIKVTRFDSQAILSANAAPGDGIQPFNMDKGEACYLGVALAFKGRKESLPRLSPDWEQALEPDLTRAVTRLEDATQPVAAPTAVSQLDTGAVQQVKALIPNIATVSVEEAKRIIQSATLSDLNAVKKETDAQITAAEQRYRQSLNGGSEADQQAARQALEQAQADQKQKLQALYAKSAAQLQAFQQLKAAAH